jgi:hypothetical protein
MSQRVSGLTVTFTGHVSQEYATVVASAIKLIGGVSSVDTTLETSETWMAEQRVRRELYLKLLDVLKE